MNASIMTAPADAIQERLLITPAEGCKFLGIGRTKMYELIRTGVVPTVKLPSCRRLYLSVDGLRQMIRDNTVFSPSDLGGGDNE